MAEFRVTGSNMPHFPPRFVWYEIMTVDMEAAKTFYTNVVGWDAQDVSRPGLPYTLFTSARFVVSGLTEVPEDARSIGARASWIGYVGVDNVDAAADRVRHLGGSVLVPPRNINAISRFSVVTDPQMATFALFKWLKPGREQPANLETIGRVGWHELLASEQDKALAFYCELFAWDSANDADSSSNYRLFSAGGQMLGSIFTKPAELPHPFWLYYFNVADVGKAAKRVTAGGGKVLEGPAEAPDGSRIIQCADPQGAVFALAEKRQYSAPGYFAQGTAPDRSAPTANKAAKPSIPAKWYGQQRKA